RGEGAPHRPAHPAVDLPLEEHVEGVRARPDQGRADAEPDELPEVHAPPPGNEGGRERRRGGHRRDPRLRESRVIRDPGPRPDRGRRREGETVAHAAAPAAAGTSARRTPNARQARRARTRVVARSPLPTARCAVTVARWRGG